ncbi:DUF2911 domain-containing protein [Ferruginibacter sp.]|uniref:DUF2911 domain-containing protein n=1 Tax=Ferruginibacter sp. TaxID=1940288 RepID=UPI0026588ABD|nr:DUF2911 domain-containing protein [Ferruginibacter sp.]
MKKKIIVFCSASLLFINIASAQINMPSPSTTQTVIQDFGMGSIELTYSRPNIKNRTVFGDLVPYGKLWRTGANGASRLTFKTPVEIGGKKIDTGSYALYTIPAEDNWEIILNKGINNGGVTGYKESEDVVRFTVPSIKTTSKTETFTMQFANIKPESCDLQLVWEKRSIFIPITTNIKDKIRAQIEAAMLTDKKPHWQAAQFYFEYDKNLTRALENVTEATDENPKAFYMFLYKARIEKEMGKTAAAMETSKTSLALSKEAKNDDYIKMNKELQKELKKAN